MLYKLSSYRKLMARFMTGRDAAVFWMFRVSLKDGPSPWTLQEKKAEVEISIGYPVFILFMHSVLHNSPQRSSWVARSGSQTWVRGWTPGLWHKRELQLDAACLGPSEKLGAWLHRKSNKRLIGINRKLHHHLWLLKWLNYLSCYSTAWMLLQRWSICSDAP